MDAKEIAGRLASRIESLCAYLLPNGKKIGHEWVDDPGAGKIKVALNGAKQGLWSHFGGDGSGDALDLWAYVRTNKDLGEAYKQAMGWLGLENPQFVGHKEKKSYKRPEKPKETKPAIRGTDVAAYLMGERGLYEETLKAFRIMEAPAMDGKRDDGSTYKVPGPWILFPYFRPEKDSLGKNILSNIKWLHVERDKDGKKRTKQESGAEPTLFGWQALDPSAKSVTITEGELDTLTVHQWGIPALSLPQGAGTGAKQNWIENDFDYLAHFETIFLWMDNDAEGQKTIPELVQRLGAHRCRIIKDVPWKDANDALVKGMMTREQIQPYFDNAPFMEPDELKNAASFFSEVLEEFYPTGEVEVGINLPWPRSRFIKLRPGELSLWHGVNSHGKSSMISQVVGYACDSGYRCCIYSGEIHARKTLSIMVRQLSGKEKPSPSLIRSMMDWVDGRLWVYDVVGKVDRTKLLEHFRYARRRWGVALFVIDSLMKCGIALDDYQAQSDFVEELTSFVDQENCHLILVAHPAKPKDESKPLGRLAIKGSGDVSDKAHNTLETWRNKAKEAKIREIEGDSKLSQIERADRLADLHDRPDTQLVCDKQREGGREGSVDLWFHSGAMAWADNRSGDLPPLKTVPIDPLDEENMAF